MKRDWSIPSIPISIRISEPTNKQLLALSKKLKVSRNQLVIEAIQGYLEKTAA